MWAMIGVFDSGVGGLGILREMLPAFSGEHVVYVADRARAPYGSRSIDEVRSFSHDVASTLIERGASTVVVACNTASAGALSSLRSSFPEIAFVGMEPALKPAREATRSGVVGVLATEVTFQGELFSSLIDQFAADLTVLTRAAPEWVELVESGTIEGPEAEAAVSVHITPLLEAGADVIVLGCTHFPFLDTTINKVANGTATLIDPAGAVARQARRVHESGEDRPTLQALASGDLDEFERLSKALTGISFPDGISNLVLT